MNGSATASWMQPAPTTSCSRRIRNSWRADLSGRQPPPVCCAAVRLPGAALAWLGLGDLGELLRVEHEDTAALEPHPFALLPLAQLLVRALARHADDLADLTLCDRNPAARAVGGEPQKRLGKARRHVEKQHILDLLAGMAQSRAQNLDQLHGELGPRREQRDEVAAIDQHQRAFGQRLRVGGSLTAIEQRNLAEDFAGLDQIEDRVLAVDRAVADPDGAGEDREKAVAGIATRKDRGARGKCLGMRVRREPIDRFRAELPKQRMGAENLTLVEIPLSPVTARNHDGLPPAAVDGPAGRTLVERRAHSMSLRVERAATRTVARPRTAPADWPVDQFARIAGFGRRRRQVSRR